MKTIWKFPLALADEIHLRMPQNAQILSVQVQDGIACLWALVDPEYELITRIVLIRGTGHPCNDVGSYISTFQMINGDLVFHAFEAVGR